MKDSLNKILAHHTGQSQEKIAEDSDRDFFMTGTEAVDYGIIDNVVANRQDLEKTAGSKKE